MAKTELLNELKGGIASFTMIGKASIKSDSFSGILQKEGKTWKHVDSQFGIDMGEGSSTYARLRGGYKTDNPLLYKFKKNGDGMLKINFKDRFNEDIHEELIPRAFFRGGLVKDENNRPVVEKFLSEIDFEEYLSEHLADGQDIKVTGEVEYSVSGDNVYRNFNIKSVYLNEAYMKDGEEVPAAEPAAFIRQTYIMDSDGLPRKWKTTLAKEGDITISAYVPQYLSSKKVGEEYVPWKKVEPIHQAIVVRVNDLENEKELKMKTAMIEKLFEVKKNKVREISIFAKINEGYEAKSGDVVIDKEMQELVDLGIISLEDVQSQVTIRGNRVSELVYLKPVFTKDQETNEASLAMNDDKYSAEALIVASMDDDDDDDDDEVEVKKEKKSEKKAEKKVEEVDPDDATSEAITDETFNELFG